MDTFSTNAHPTLSSADPAMLLLECSLSTLAVPHGRQWSFPTSMDALLLPMVADLQGQPETKHDMASLAFTIASLLAGGSVPWFGFSGCNVELYRLSERSNIATKLLGDNDNKLKNETTRTLFLIESIHGLLTGVQTRSKKRPLASPAEQREGARSTRNIKMHAQ